MTLGRFTATAMVLVAILVGPSSAAAAPPDPEADPPVAINGWYQMHAELTTIQPPGAGRCVYLVRNGLAGQVCFQPYGDEFWIKDWKSDGLYIQMHGNLTFDRHEYTCYTTRTAAAGWQVCRGPWWAGNIPEGGEIMAFRPELHRRNADGSWTLVAWGTTLNKPTT